MGLQRINQPVANLLGLSHPAATRARRAQPGRPRILRGVLGVVLCSIVWVMLSATSPSAFGQEAATVEPPELASPLQKLNKAIDRKMTAQRMSDLQSVIDLAEEALEGGLDEKNQKFARQLLSATLYERAERLVETLGDGKLDLAWARRRQLALDSLNKATEMNTLDADAFLLLADLHELPGGDKEKGLEAAEKAVNLINEDPQRRSDALMTLAAFRKAPEDRLSDYDKALKLNPKNSDALRERGKTNLELGKVDEALADFQLLLNENKTDIESVEIVSQLLAKQEKYDEAVDLINEVIEGDPESPSGYILRANVLFSKKEYESARADLSKALKLNPRNLAALLTRSQIYSAEENFKEALADVSRALELRPGMFQAVVLRSQIALAAKDYKQSLADLRLLLRNDRKNVGLRLQIAAVYVADERPNMAIDMYDRVIEENEEEWEAFRGRADAWLGMGEHAKAIADYKKAIKGMPEDTGLLNNFAWVLATSTTDDVRDGEQAIELAKKACELTEYKAAHIISTLAASYAEAGNFDKAIEWSSKAVELSEDLTDREIGVQLAEELANYKSKKPWRERQEFKEEGLDDDLGSGN